MLDCDPADKALTARDRPLRQVPEVVIGSVKQRFCEDCLHGLTIIREA